MNRILILITTCLLGCLVVAAQDPQAAERYQREAEYYQRQAESYEHDADWYLRQARSAQSDAAYYIRNNNPSRARDYYRRAAEHMDTYRSKLESARTAAARSKDYLRRAADALI